MTIFCVVYYVSSYIERIPQIAKLIKTKSSHDYSLGMLFLQFLSLVCWSLYIFTSDQKMIVYIGTVTDLLVLIFVDFMILKYYKNYKTEAEEKKEKVE